MGADFQEMVVPTSRSTDEVRMQFYQAQTRDRYENGHLYSGGFGQADGIAFRAERFDSYDQAHEWLLQNARKWHEALAVRFVDHRDKDIWGSVNEYAGQEVWLIGAWCAS